MKNQKEILNSLFWPLEKMNFFGNLSFSTSFDLETMIQIDISRTNKTLEVFYGVSPMFSPKDKTFFVKLYMNKIEDNYVVDFEKSSSDIKNEKDVEDSLQTIKNAIIKSNSKPLFFTTGVVENKKLNNKI